MYSDPLASTVTVVLEVQLSSEILRICTHFSLGRVRLRRNATRNAFRTDAVLVAFLQRPLSHWVCTSYGQNFESTEINMDDADVCGSLLW